MFYWILLLVHVDKCAGKGLIFGGVCERMVIVTILNAIKTVSPEKGFCDLQTFKFYLAVKTELQLVMVSLLLTNILDPTIHCYS